MRKFLFFILIIPLFLALSFPVTAVDIQPVPPSTQSIEISTDKIITTNVCPEGCTCVDNTVSCPVPLVTPSSPACPIGCTCSNGLVSCRVTPISKVCPVGCDCSEQGTIKCPTEQRPIDVEIQTLSNPVPVRIQKIENSVSVESEGVSATTQQKLILNNSKLYLGSVSEEKQIRISPQEALSKIEKTTEVQRFELTQPEEKPVYEITGVRQAKILYLFPVSIPIETKIDANTGEILSVTKPWWDLLAR